MLKSCKIAIFHLSFLEVGAFNAFVSEVCFVVINAVSYR